MKYLIKTYSNFDDELLKYWKNLERNAFFHPFQSLSWIKSWYDFIGNPNKITPCIVIVLIDEKPQMIIPLGLNSNLGFKVVDFLASEQSDYSAPIMNREFIYNESSFQVLWKDIINLIPKFDILKIKNIPKLINEKYNPMYPIGICSEERSYYLKIDSIDYDQFSKNKIKKRILQDNERQKKRLNKIGKLSFVVFNKNTEQKENIFYDFIDFKVKQYELTNSFNIFSNTQILEFYKNIFLDNHSKETHFSCLYLNNNVISIHLGMISNGTYYYLLPTYDRNNYDKYSPGRILLTELIKWCLKNKYKVFDFTIGAENYKKNWTDSEMQLSEIIIINNYKGKIINIKNNIFIYLKKLYKSSSIIRFFISARNPIIKYLI